MGFPVSPTISHYLMRYGGIKWGTAALRLSPGHHESGNPKWRAWANFLLSKSKRRRGRQSCMMAAAFTSGSHPGEPNHGSSGSSSTANAGTWGSDPILIFPGGGPCESHRTSKAAPRRIRPARCQSRSTASAADRRGEGQNLPRMRRGFHRQEPRGLAKRETPAAVGKHPRHLRLSRSGGIAGFRD
jgi:hypothetical protein